MKTRLFKIKFSNKNSFPSYHIPLLKSQKEFLAAQKSLRILKLLRVLINRALFQFFSDRVLFRVLSDRLLFESSVMGSSSGSSVTILLFGHQCSSSGMPLFFYQNVLCNLLPLVVITRCHSFYYSLSFLVVTRCHLLYHSFSLIVIRYHSLSLDVTLVCFFYKRSNLMVIFFCKDSFVYSANYRHSHVKMFSLSKRNVTKTPEVSLESLF